MRVGARVSEPEPVSPVRAVAGAAVAVAGVALGIGAVLTLTSEPDERPGPTVAAPSVPARTVPARTVPPPTVPPQAVPARPPSATPSPPAPSPAPTTAPPVAPSRPEVTVLNNSRRTGLARRAADEVAAAGWPVREVGNFTGRLEVTTVYYAPGQRTAAQRLAGALDVPRVLPRFRGLPGSGLTLVLTRDYRA